MWHIRLSKCTEYTQHEHSALKSINIGKNSNGVGDNVAANK